MGDVVDLEAAARERAKRRHPSYTHREVLRAVLDLVDDALAPEAEEDET